VKPRDLALAVLVAAVWGTNFVAISIGLDDLPPLLFNALRFGLAAIPAVFFVGRPVVAWRWVIAIGLSLGVVKFSLLFAGMAAGMPAGLSSLVLQIQAVFTVIFAAVLLRERPVRRQIAGLAAAWGISNVAMRRASASDMLNLIVWVSAVATPVLVVLTLLVDGPEADLAALRSMSWSAVGALLFVSGLATLWGWAVWGTLIRRYGASTVAPFSMLVPFFGIASAALVLREPVHPTDILGGLLVVGGVLTGALAARGRNRAPADATDPDVAPAARRKGSAARRQKVGRFRAVRWMGRSAEWRTTEIPTTR
jgi:O-acetylserine/cysteine efflux transporter